MSAHTPGPWIYFPSIPEEGVNCWWIERVGKPARTIGCVDGPQGTHTEPDARLIAAAPELLEALQTLMRVHDEPAGFAGKYGRKLDELVEAQRVKVDHATSLARAAINKATGAGHE